MEGLKFEDILIVIVLYKKTLRESETLMSLEKSLSHNLLGKYTLSGKLDIYIYDNSPERLKIEPNKYFNIIYVHDPTNPGVSKAYNAACQKAKSFNKQWILIFDQDTSLPLEAIEAYSKAILNVEIEINIIAPKLFSGNKIISPCRYILHRGFPLSSVPIGKFELKGHSFLNSGLLLRVCSIRKAEFFDENLFNYSDHDFLIRFAKKNKYAKIMDLELEQDWSSAVAADDDQTVNRFMVLARDSRYMAQKYHSIFPILWLIARSFKLFLLTKRCEYIKISIMRYLYG
jgi:rhamnosyltransferase